MHLLNAMRFQIVAIGSNTFFSDRRKCAYKPTYRLRPPICNGNRKSLVESNPVVCLR